MKFNDIATSQIDKFSIGREEVSKIYYLSIPVSNPYMDYDEYYKLSEEMFSLFRSDMSSALDFVKRCRERKNDSLLIQKPGRLRGFPT